MGGRKFQLFFALFLLGFDKKGRQGDLVWVGGYSSKRLCGTPSNNVPFCFGESALLAYT